MEFRYRAVDVNPPPPPPPYGHHQMRPSSAHSYFTEQTIRAGYSIPGSGGANECFNSGSGLANGYSNLSSGQTNECLNAGLGWVNEYFSKPLDVLETIQREIEKEKIREEVIAAEIARRRELEAEVRREMMIGRELVWRVRRGEADAFDGFSFPFGGRMELEPKDDPLLKGRALEERIAMSLEEKLRMRGGRESSRHEMVPLLQRSIEPKIKEVMSSPTNIQKEKDKIVILAKPDASHSGIKRKAVPHENAGVNHISGGVSMKAKEEWSCALCQVSATSERALKDHTQGKKHKSKEAALRAQRNGTNIGLGTSISSETRQKSREELSQFNQATKSSLQINSSKKLLKESNVSMPEGSDKTDKTRKKKLGVQKYPKKVQKKEKITFWCEMCQVGAHSEKVMEAHRKGTKHTTRLQNAKENGTVN